MQPKIGLVGLDGKFEIHFTEHQDYYSRLMITFQKKVSAL